MAQRQETGHCQLELSLRHSAGSSFPAELGSEIFSDSSGRYWASIVVRDISARLAQSAGQNRVVAQVAALRDAHHQADITRRIAVGVNDDIVQSLVAAEMAFDLGQLDQARDVACRGLPGGAELGRRAPPRGRSAGARFAGPYRTAGVEPRKQPE